MQESLGIEISEDAELLSLPELDQEVYNETVYL